MFFIRYDQKKKSTTGYKNNANTGELKEKESPAAFGGSSSGRASSGLCPRASGVARGSV